MIQNSINAEENQVFSGNIYVYPSEPTPLSKVNFTIGVNKNITVEDVRLIAEECIGDMRFSDYFNVSMNYTFSCCWAFYETQIKLIHENATTIKYYVKIFSNGTWIDSDDGFTNLSSPVNNNPVIDPENRSAPGFELVFILFSISLFLILKKRNI